MTQVKDALKRHDILVKTHNKCAHCGKELTKYTMTVDHYIPISKGGKSNFKNLYPLCQECNLEKANDIYHPEDAYKHLIMTYMDDLYGQYNWYMNKLISEINGKLKTILVFNYSYRLFCEIPFGKKSNINQEYDTLEFGRNRKNCKSVTNSKILQKEMYILLTDIIFDEAILMRKYKSVIVLVTNNDNIDTYKKDLLSYGEYYFNKRNNKFIAITYNE